MIVSNHLTRLTATRAKRRYERLFPGVRLDVRKESHRRFKWAVVKENS